MIAIPAAQAAPIENDTALPLDHPALRALLGRWQAHRGRRPLPSEADLLFFNLKPWLGRVRRVAVGDGGRTFRLLPCAHFRIAPPGDALLVAYRRAAFGATPVRAAPRPGTEGLVLPFADDRRAVSLLLVALYDGAELAA